MRDLQELDCNCSDCVHLTRSISKRQNSVDLHYDWQKHQFNTKRIKLIEAAEKWVSKGEKEKAKILLKEARKMVFHFDESECAIHYGECGKFDKEISFIPNILQLHTQECFEDRIKTNH